MENTIENRIVQYSGYMNLLIVGNPVDRCLTWRVRVLLLREFKNYSMNAEVTAMQSQVARIYFINCISLNPHVLKYIR